MSLKNELKDASKNDGSSKGEGLPLPSLNDISGYDSDKLCPIDPLYYCVLASYYSLQGNSNPHLTLT